MGNWRVLVSLHNLVNIPPAACEDPSRRFAVEVRQVNTNSGTVSGQPRQSNPAATFTAGEVTESTPRVFEIRLDDVTRRGPRAAGSSCAWRCAKDIVDILVEIVEDGQRGKVLVGSSTTFQIDVKKVVEDAKLVTRIVGTEMGQVGLSFSVDPEDRAGYQGRLEDFLKRFNPRGLHLVQNVVDIVPEVDTFTKLYRKYHLRDYEKRLKDFFAMYGPEYVQDIPSLLRQWENREEELMRNLILDNGPELCDVDVNQRLTAFLTQYRLQRSDPVVRGMAAAHAEDPAGLFDDLKKRYGGEPDPRNYLFPATHYTGAAPRPAGCSPPPMGASITPLRPAPVPTRSASAKSPLDRRADASPYLSLLGASSSSSPERSGGAGGGGRKHPQPAPTAPTRSLPPQSASSGVRNRRSDDGFFGNAVFDDQAGVGDPLSPSHADTLGASSGSRSGQQGRGGRPEREPTVAAASADTGRTAGDGPSRLWLRMNTMLRTSDQETKRSSLRPGFFYYCSEGTFRDLVDSLDTFSKDERASLMQEWICMCRNAVEEATMDQTSPGFDGAVAEAAQAAELQPVQLQVASMTSFLHREQYTYFHARLAAAKEPRMERLILVGDHKSLLTTARHGVGERTGHEPVAVFARNPFAQWKQAKTTCLLVCDVVVGRCFRGGDRTGRLPHSGTNAFLEQYDSSTFTEHGTDDCVAVYDPQQVLPRLLLHCTIDPMLAPCPSHPNRPVEYYVVDDNAVACSRCVVLGEYKGREVLPIEEAATQARGKLAEMQRAADSMSECMGSFGTQLLKEEAMMATAPRRLEAEKEIERLRREVEERVASIVAAVEQQDKEQRARIRANQQESEAIREAARSLAAELGCCVNATNPMAVVQALQRAKQERAIDGLLARARERIPSATVQGVRPLGNENNDSALRLIGMQNHTPASAIAQKPNGRGAAASAFVETPPKLPPPTRPYGTPSAAASAAVPARSRDVYAKYQSLAPQIEGQEAPRARRPPPPHQQPSLLTDSPPPRRIAGESGLEGEPASGQSCPASETAALASAHPASATAITNPKQALTKGWALLHKGSESRAAAEWLRVCEAFDENEVPGAKARAYLAEAIDKDYETAARWYQRCLQLDPADRLTAYNYGVLLEALLRRPQEAIAMYEKAAALGDHVAAARSEQLRVLTDDSVHSFS